MTLDPDTGRIFLVSGDVAKTEPSPKLGHSPHIVFVPGSVKLVWLDPQE